MRLAILNITAGGISGGYRKYLSAVIPRLSASADVEKILCVAPFPLAAEGDFSCLTKVEFFVCEPFRFLRHRLADSLEEKLDDFRPDVIFVPLERYVKYRNVPVVNMLQNMEPLSKIRVKREFFDKVRCIAQAYEASRAVKNADMIITPTDYVKTFLMENLDVRENKIVAVHYGSDTLPENPQPPGNLGKNGIFPGHYILTVGSMEVYRGIEDLIRVMIPLRKDFPGLKLLIAGGTRSGTERYFCELQAFAEKCGLVDDIIWLGHLSDQELSWCYLNCSAFVMTSREESFGLVALEALAHGCRCISTTSACMPEIFQDSALYYNPGDIDGLEKLIGKILKANVAEKAKLAANAVQRASMFSWNETVRKTIDVFKMCKISKHSEYSKSERKSITE